MRPPLIYLEGEYSSSCGYCKHSIKSEPSKQQGECVSEKRKTFGMEAYNVPAGMYDQLIQYNWRRCGSLYYRPNNATMCCPQYAIRVHASQIQIKQPSHRRVLRKLRQYLYDDSSCPSPGSMETDEIDPEDQKKEGLLISLTEIVDQCFKELMNAEFPAGHEYQVPVKLQARQGKSQKMLITCNVLFVLAGLLKKKNSSTLFDIAALADKLKLAVESTKLLPDTIEHMEATANGYLTFRTSFTHSGDSKKKKSKHINPKTSEQKWKLVLVVERSTFKEDEFDMYSSYQQTIHHDLPSKITKRGYTDFLCNSSLNPEADDDFMTEIEVDINESGTDLSFSPMIDEMPKQSLHIRYELHSLEDPNEKKLLAVSVTDALPSGLSSVYFLYDPQYAHLSLGVASALIEILLIKHLNSNLTESSWQYYYLGYYIHGCSKMRYKGQYEPSEILCPVTLRWTPLDNRTRQLLDGKIYIQISAEEDIDDEKQQQFVDIKNCLYLINQKYIVYADNLLQKATFEPAFLERFNQFQQLAPAKNVLGTGAVIILLESDMAPIDT